MKLQDMTPAEHMMAANLHAKTAESARASKMEFWFSRKGRADFIRNNQDNCAWHVEQARAKAQQIIDAGLAALENGKESAHDE